MQVIYFLSLTKSKSRFLTKYIIFCYVCMLYVISRKYVRRSKSCN